ncbi:hypothetical protein PFISCL1PPCAC_24507 [Pristionchus fissidentatus]|uniref:G protein-coupled receptor n=1 Tax=Pristionchus fissidentatus TaxID=1538716 RepID=A0AAV5WRN6_9BILA|nr:hypothetical protein PFISCL1PPCAC_24507 [Pristionchus fissidentatus]
MAYSLSHLLLAFVALNIAIFTWVFRTSIDPLTTTLQLTIPLLIWEALLFASFAPDELLNLLIPHVEERSYGPPADLSPGPHGDCWSDEPTEYDTSSRALSTDFSDSDTSVIYHQPVPYAR